MLMYVCHAMFMSQTLYDQIQANKDKWQEEFDANTKKLFAPGKALDEDDIRFFDEQREAQLEKERVKKEQALADLLDFKSAQVRNTCVLYSSTQILHSSIAIAAAS